MIFVFRKRTKATKTARHGNDNAEKTARHGNDKERRERKYEERYIRHQL